METKDFYTKPDLKEFRIQTKGVIAQSGGMESIGEGSTENVDNVNW